MSPIPGYRVIPKGWSARHQPVAEGGMTAVCSMFSIDSGPAPFPLPDGWDGLVQTASGIRCRAQVLNNSNSAISADQPTGTRQYLIAVPINGLPEIVAGEGGTIIRVTEAVDPGLIGRTLRVIDIQHGNEMFQRDLICLDNLTQNNP